MYARPRNGKKCYASREGLRGWGVIKTSSENRKVWRQLGNRYTALCIEENHLRCLENCGLIRHFSKKEGKK